MTGLFIYVTVGVVTGYQIYASMMWAVWGAPSSPLRLLPLAAAAGMVVAAALSPSRPSASTIVATACLLVLWTFYVPSVTGAPDTLTLLQPAVWLPMLTLAVATVYAAVQLVQWRRESR